MLSPGIEEILRRIETRLAEVGLSERKACLKADIGVDAVRSMRRQGTLMKIERLAALAKVLDVPLTYLVEPLGLPTGDAVATPLRKAPLPQQTIMVRGWVQAGVWREAIEWDQDDWYSVTVNRDERFPDAERFALEVRGESMNRLYPNGSVIVCVRFADIGRGPSPGERVICLRRSADGQFEATVKEFDQDTNGRRLLWPRSDHPDFQAPLLLPAGPLPISHGYEPYPGTAHAGGIEDAAGLQDLLISGLVIQSVRSE